MTKGRNKDNTNLVYLLLVVIVVLIVVIGYFILVKPSEALVVVASDEQAVEVKQDLSTSISDIKDDLEQLKESLRK